MNDILKVAIPAIIVLIGTIITVLIGYRQWKRQQETSRYGTFLTEKQSAYKELWEKLEDVHIKLRTEDVGITEFNNLVREVNSYILKKGLYIEEIDREYSSRYLKSIFEMKEIIAKPEDEIDEIAHIEMEESWSLTDPGLPVEVTSQARELIRIAREVDETRNMILERFRKIIGGSLNI